MKTRYKIGKAFIYFHEGSFCLEAKHITSDFSGFNKIRYYISLLPLSHNS